MTEPLPVVAHQMDGRKVRLARNSALGERPDGLVAVDSLRELDHEHEPSPAVSTVIGAREIEALNSAQRRSIQRGDAGATREQRLETLELGQPQRAGDVG